MLSRTFILIYHPSSEEYELLIGRSNQYDFTSRMDALFSERDKLRQSLKDGKRPAVYTARRIKRLRDICTTEELKVLFPPTAHRAALIRELGN